VCLISEIRGGTQPEPYVPRPYAERTANGKVSYCLQFTKAGRKALEEWLRKHIQIAPAGEGLQLKEITGGIVLFKPALEKMTQRTEAGKKGPEPDLSNPLTMPIGNNGPRKETLGE